MNNFKDLIELGGEQYDEGILDITMMVFEQYYLLNEKEKKELDLALFLITSPEYYFKNNKKVVFSTSDVIYRFYKITYHTINDMKNNKLTMESINFLDVLMYKFKFSNIEEFELKNKEFYLLERFSVFFQKLMMNWIVMFYQQDKSIADAANKFTDIIIKLCHLTGFPQNLTEENDDLKKGKIFIELNNINFNSIHFKKFIEKLKLYFFKSNNIIDIKNIFKPHYENDIKKVIFHGSKGQLKSFLLTLKDFSNYEDNKDLYDVAILLVNVKNDDILKIEQLVHGKKVLNEKFNETLKETFECLRNARIK